METLEQLKKAWIELRSQARRVNHFEIGGHLDPRLSAEIAAIEAKIEAMDGNRVLTTGISTSGLFDNED